MELIIDAGGTNDRLAVALETCSRQHIRNERPKELPPEMIQAGLEMDRKTNPNAKLRSASSTYNCMGMVFASRRTCIDIEELEFILKEDKYRRLSGLNEVEVGDVVVYYENETPTHVGLIIGLEFDIANASREVKVLSKWGHHGEYIHLIQDVPYQYGIPKAFWTDRRKPS
ncbi:MULTISPECIES: hypothetical protein [Leptolyngbya]|uniref:hypothetical protein n=1 Tax=Leptolyngbya TaxID=47251 RepID=UPI001688A67C|nr:hypothetical protein [Leptolyngbya sp. FACHB-1624]MBD1856454.1 hypothetical protein [Leptolyngbya sp. FACHB-1624]